MGTEKWIIIEMFGGCRDREMADK